MLERTKMAAPKARSTFYDDRFRSRSRPLLLGSLAPRFPLRLRQFCYLRPCPIAIADRPVGNDQSATAENINVEPGLILSRGNRRDAMRRLSRGCFSIKSQRSACTSRLLWNFYKRVYRIYIYISFAIRLSFCIF